MDEDGGNVKPIAPMTISSALHPDHPARRPPHVLDPRGSRAARQAAVGHLGDLARRPHGDRGERLPSRAGVSLHDPALERGPGRRRLLQPQQQRLRRSSTACRSGRRQASRLPQRISRGQPPIWHRHGRLRPVQDAVHAARPATRSRRSPTARTRQRRSAPTARASASSRIPRRHRRTTCWWSGRRAGQRPRSPVKTPYYDAGLYLHPDGGEIVVSRPSWS